MIKNNNATAVMKTPIPGQNPFSKILTTLLKLNIRLTKTNKTNKIIVYIAVSFKFLNILQILSN